MSVNMTVTNLEGEDVPLGQVSYPTFTMPVQSSANRTQCKTLSLDFLRILGQLQDDPADHVFFQLMAGDGHGEVKETTVTIELINPTTHVVVGTWKLKAKIFSYQERDVGEAVEARVVLCAESYEYQPAKGDQIIGGIHKGDEEQTTAPSSSLSN